MLAVDGLRTEYREGREPFVAVDDVSFTVPRGKFFTLLGPSGAGKSTVLRAVAGLERPVAGEIAIDGRIASSVARGVFVPPHRRRLGMVFQSYAIWPHLNVFENAAFPLRVAAKKIAASEIADRVGKVLAMVGLGDYSRRPSTQLSGGQQQRLALARALTRRPRLLLLDEPL